MGQKRKAPPRGASRQVKKPARSVPGWLWMICGLVLGLFIALLLQLLPHRADLRAVAPVASDEPTSIVVPAKEKPPQPVFDFYSRLAENEVKVIETGERQKARPKTPAVTAVDKLPVATPDRYLLQAGSFRRETDADRLRAKLLLQGLDAKIKKVRVENGNEWHRVQVGPFTSSHEMQQARSALSQQGIAPLVLKLK